MKDKATKVADACVHYWKTWDRFVDTPWSPNKWTLTRDLDRAEKRVREAMKQYEKEKAAA